MKIEKYVIGALETNCYIVMNEENHEMLLVDPGDSPDHFVEHLKVLEQKGYKLKAILLTHGHFDHMKGVERIVGLYQVPVYALEEELNMLEDPSLNLSEEFFGNGISVEGTIGLSDHQKLTLIGYEFQVIATPGHTSGGCCYYVEEEEVLFSGDTLFARSIGRTDFVTGDMMAIMRSLKGRLALLPDDTMVYPGHMQLTSIGEEKRLNPYFK